MQGGLRCKLASAHVDVVVLKVPVIRVTSGPVSEYDFHMYDSALSLAHSMQCQPSNRPTTTATCAAPPLRSSTVLLEQRYLRIYAREVIREIFKFSLSFWHNIFIYSKNVSFAFQNRGVGPLCVSSLKTRVLGANYQEQFEK